MKPWLKSIQFSQPPRAIRLATGNAADTRSGAASQKSAPPEELAASYERGRVDGEKALSEALMRQRAELHEAMEGALKSLRQAVPQVVRDTETTLVAFAMSVAQKIVSEMPISVNVVEAAVRDALRQVEGAARFTVRVHPADLELLQPSGSPLLNPADEDRDFRFLSSAEVTRGGCLVQTQFGTVDARRETKFDLLKAALVA
jgi:flagellar biosynthesis/type III secretory pathway protein FliH